MYAPDKIWALSYDKNIVTCGGDEMTIRSAEWLTSPCGSDPEYHLARPNQPCSTDSFLDMLFNERIFTDGEFLHRLNCWRMGDFTAAMDGLQ